MIRLYYLAYCIGIIIAGFIPAISVSGLGAGLALILALLIGTRLFDRSITKLMLGIVAVCVIGFCWHMLMALNSLSKQLPADLEGVDLTLTGVVQSIPIRYEFGSRFSFSVSEPRYGFKGLIELSVYDDVQFRAGEQLDVIVRLKVPHGTSNPGGFDREAHWLRNSIVATGYVRELIARRPAADYSFIALRQALYDSLIKVSEDSSHQGLILALVLGEKSLLSAETQSLLAITGTSHLAVISGLHISLISGLLYFAASHALKRLPLLALYVPRQKIAGLVALLAAVFYAALAGFTLPTLRALSMFSVFIIATLMNRNIGISQRFLAALAVVLTADPLAATSAGFWFSFVAVASLIYFAVGEFHKEELARKTVKPIEQDWGDSSLIDRLFQKLMLFLKWFVISMKSQIVVFLCLVFPLAYWGAPISIFSPFINLLGIPLVGLLLTPLCLLTAFIAYLSTDLGKVVYTVTEFIAMFFMYGLNLVTSTLKGDGFTFYINLPHLDSWLSFLVYGFAVIALLLLLLPTQWRSKLLLLPLLSPMFFSVDDSTIDGFRLHVLDVGQGLAVVIRTARHTMLYDAGFAATNGFSLGESVVLPFLNFSKIKQLDALVISHSDADHRGGLEAVLKGAKVDKLLVNNPSEYGLDTPVYSCAALQPWVWDGVRFEFLKSDQKFNTSNNSSCVLRVSVGGSSALLPGDIERIAELDYVLSYGEKLQSTLLIAPHHGSSSSSSYPFLKTVQPQLVAVSSGYRNRFGHPANEVLQRYQNFGSTIYQTQHLGMLEFNFGSYQAAEPEIMAYRKDRPRYWRCAYYCR